MDQFDRRLLNLLQANSRQTAEALSRKVGLSPAACQKRLKRLRDSGIIAREVAILSDPAVGGLTLIVEVVTDREDEFLPEPFHVAMKRSPNVMQCYYVTGETDYIVILSVRDMAEYDAFARRHFGSGSNVRRYQTHVVRSDIKVTLAKPLSED